MRITQHYSVNSLLNRISETRSQIYKNQRNLATGKRINSISDDPDNIENVMRLHTRLDLNARFENNLNDSLNFMAITSQALDDASDTMAHVQELAIQAVNTTEDSDWSALSSQVDQMLNQMVELSNTKFGGRYVFGGSYASEQPFQLNTDSSAVIANPNGLDGDLKVEIGDLRITKYNVNGSDAFQGGVDVFQTIIDLRDAITAKDGTAVQGLMDQIDNGMDQIVQQNGTLGAQINRFDLFSQQYQNEDLKLKEFLSGLEDTDMAQAITDLQMDQTGLQTALQVLSKTVNISLVDYM